MNVKIKLPAFLVEWIINRAKKNQYFHLHGYMNRFWFIPRNRFVSARVHEILRSDSGRHFHDHPWASLSIILKGGYNEITPVFDADGRQIAQLERWFGPGSVILRKAKTFHRLEVPSGEPCTTLFFMGPRRQTWGFLVSDRKKKSWLAYDQANNFGAAASDTKPLPTGGMEG